MRQETDIRAEVPLSPVRRWRIHLGAHKTATTHLQETLSAARLGLVNRGIDFIPNDIIRGERLAQALRRRRPLARLPFVGPAHMRDVLEAIVQPLRLGPETVVLSEENIVGLPRQLFATPIYPPAAQSVARLASLGLRAELTLFLSIRSYDTLLPSAYAEALKHAPPAPGGFEAARARLLAAPPSWFDLIRRIRGAAPGVPLRAWRQEDYRANERAVMEALCGCELGALPEITDPSWTRSPSPVGIAAAEALPPDLPQDVRRDQVVEIYEASAGTDRFQPFSQAERRQLRAAYDADLERIARSYPEALLSFAKELAA